MKKTTFFLCFGIFLFLAIALYGFLQMAFLPDQSWIFEPYFITITLFTLKQAFLSALLSLILGLIAAKSVHALSFPFKSSLILSLNSFFVLPQWIVITAIIAVYGQSGWILTALSALPFAASFSIYGLPGILIAHVFLNLPLATLFCLSMLEAIPKTQYYQADALRLSSLQRFKWIEWPFIKKAILPLGGLIFMLCFCSFAIVLTLGGGPKSTTLEVAIYQAIRELDYASAFLLTAIQALLAFIMLTFLNRFQQAAAPLSYQESPCKQSSSKQLGDYRSPLSLLQKIACACTALLFFAFLFSPILALMIQGLFYFHLEALNIHLWRAFLLSIEIAFFASLLCLGLSALLLMRLCEAPLVRAKSQKRFLLLPQMIFIFPPMMIASGLYLFFEHCEQRALLMGLIIALNALLAFPFVFKSLHDRILEPYQQALALAKTLHLNGFQHFFILAYLPFKSHWRAAFKLAFLLSLGDFSLIIYFGHSDFATLPYYLYDLISHYRFNEAISVAMLFYTFIVLILIVNIKEKR